MKPPEMTGPLRVEEVDGHLWVVGENIACLCGDRAEADALLADLRLRIGNRLMDGVRTALKALAATGWITTTEPDHEGIVCRGFDANPDAAGFASVVHPVPDDHVVIEVGEGLGDENADMVAAETVVLALQEAGLRAGIGMDCGVATVVAQLQRGGGA